MFRENLFGEFLCLNSFFYRCWQGPSLTLVTFREISLRALVIRVGAGHKTLYFLSFKLNFKLSPILSPQVLELIMLSFVMRLCNGSAGTL